MDRGEVSRETLSRKALQFFISIHYIPFPLVIDPIEIDGVK